MIFRIYADKDLRIYLQFNFYSFCLKKNSIRFNLSICLNQKHKLKYLMYLQFEVTFVFLIHAWDFSSIPSILFSMSWTNSWIFLKSESSDLVSALWLDNSLDHALSVEMSKFNWMIGSLLSSSENKIFQQVEKFEMVWKEG